MKGFILDRGAIEAGAAAGNQALCLALARRESDSDQGIDQGNARCGKLKNRQILPHAALVVSHGGSGSVAGALAHGLPMLITPMGADQLDNAARVQALGIGRWLDPVAVTPAEVRDAAAEILSTPSYHQAAAGMRAAYAALPGPEHAVTLLERLILTRAPVVTG